MKNFTLTILSFFLLTQIISAQEHFPKGRWGIPGGKIAELEKIKLIEELQMDEETTLRFFSRRSLHFETQRKTEFRRDSLLTLLNNKIKEGDSKLNYLMEIDKILDIDKELSDERLKFFKSLSNIFSHQQLAKLLIFEKNFRNEIRKQILRQGRGRRGQAPELD